MLWSRKSLTEDVLLLVLVLVICPWCWCRCSSLTADVHVLVLLLVLVLVIGAGAGAQPSRNFSADLADTKRAMTTLSWNCQGSGGSLSNSKMNQLARLLNSTKCQCLLWVNLEGSGFSERTTSAYQ